MKETCTDNLGHLAGVAFISGWGSTGTLVPSTVSRLRYAVVPIIPNDVCNAIYTGTIITITDEMMCTGLPKERDSCKGKMR